MSVIDQNWIQKRSTMHVDWKAALAKYAANHLISHGDAVYMASGTSMSALMWEVVTRQAGGDLLDLLVITGNLQIINMGREAPANGSGLHKEAQARFLDAFQATQILVTGGILNPSLDSLVGDLAVRGIMDPAIYPNTVFCGARGLSFSGGLTMTYQFTDEMSAQIAYATRPTRRRVVLCDHTKLGAPYGLKAMLDIGALLEKANECIFLSSLPDKREDLARVDSELKGFEQLCASLVDDSKYEHKELALWMITKKAERHLQKEISLTAMRRANERRTRGGSRAIQVATVPIKENPQPQEAPVEAAV